MRTCVASGNWVEQSLPGQEAALNLLDLKQAKG
jgi:hypothetical protein